MRRPDWLPPVPATNSATTALPTKKAVSRMKSRVERDRLRRGRPQAGEQCGDAGVVLVDPSPILLAEYGADGAFGLVLNRRMPEPAQAVVTADEPLDPPAAGSM